MSSPVWVATHPDKGAYPLFSPETKTIDRLILEGWTCTEMVPRAELDAAQVSVMAFSPTAAGINALPDSLRKFIHDLETRCDPAGDIQQIAALKDQRDALLAKLDAAVKERDAMLAAAPRTRAEIVALDQLHTVTAHRDRLLAGVREMPCSCHTSNRLLTVGQQVICTRCTLLRSVGTEQGGGEVVKGV